MYCWGCGHAIVLGPGGECAECAAPHPLPAAPEAAVGRPKRRVASGAAAALGGVVALAGAGALGIALADLAREVLR